MNSYKKQKEVQLRFWAGKMGKENIKIFQLNMSHKAVICSKSAFSYLVIDFR